jgi:DeoR family transcriptional regulator of aga operon
MIEIADRVVVITDHSKFGRTETVSLAPLDGVHALVIDIMPPAPYPKLLARHHVELIVAS